MSNSASALGLAEEHAALQQELERRVERVLRTLAGGHWPTDETRRLLDYLRYEVLDQAVNEERLLYPLTDEGFAGPRIHELVDDHIQLRDLADRLAAVLDSGAHDAARLAAAVHQLRERLSHHLSNEEEVLGPVSDTGIESVRLPYHSHEWFVLTEGATVDMDRLPPASGHAAVLERLARMRPGERLEITSGRSLQAVHGLLVRRGMSAVYGWVYLEEGPRRWRAQVTRRTSG
jgi:uncharacterized protein (DUF2249 family)